MGDGVLWVTSISMTLFWSLESIWLVSFPLTLGFAGIQLNSYPHPPFNMGAQVYYTNSNSPFSKPPDTLLQVSSCLELRIRHRNNINLRETIANNRTQVLWEGSEGIISTLSSPEQGLASKSTPHCIQRSACTVDLGLTAGVREVSLQAS